MSSNWHDRQPPEHQRKVLPLLVPPLCQELDFETTEKRMLLTRLPPKARHLNDSSGPAKGGNHMEPVSLHGSLLN